MNSDRTGVKNVQESGNDHEVTGIRCFAVINLETRPTGVSAYKVYRSCGLEASHERVFALFTVIVSRCRYEHRLNALMVGLTFSLLCARYIVDNINSRVIDGSN